MELYHLPVTPHQNKLKGLKPLQSTMENAPTPFPSKTPFGKGSVKQVPRRALGDISNNNTIVTTTTLQKPMVISKSTVKKPQPSRHVTFDEEIDTCTRKSKYKATPYKVEVEQAVRAVGRNWYQELSPKKLETPIFEDDAFAKEFQVKDDDYADDNIIVFEDINSEDLML